MAHGISQEALVSNHKVNLPQLVLLNDIWQDMISEKENEKGKHIFYVFEQDIT